MLTTSTDSGGIVGSSPSTYFNNYFDNQTSGHNDNILGNAARTTAILQQTLDNSTATFTNWDFHNIWDPGSVCDYPRLRWQNEPLKVSCVLHDGSDNATSVSRSAEIQIGFNRPLDNTTLIFGDTLQITPAVSLENFSYDNTTQILTLQPSEPLQEAQPTPSSSRTFRRTITSAVWTTTPTPLPLASWGQLGSRPPTMLILLLSIALVWKFSKISFGCWEATTVSVSNQVWTSENGVDWSIFSTSTQSLEMWGQRQNHSSAVFQDKLWVLGGHSGAGANPNSIWSSPNGVTWSNTENSEWSKRWRPSTVVFQDKLWVIGGYHSGWKNDAWSSVDGSNWIQESYQVWPSGGAESTAVAFDGKIWVLGGWNTSGH